MVSALLADAVALWAIAARITEFGFSPNRVAALGVNVILLVNLAWSAVLLVRFLRGRGSFAKSSSPPQAEKIEPPMARSANAITGPLLSIRLIPRSEP
mgnify:CR=1 FL=1